MPVLSETANILLGVRINRLHIHRVVLHRERIGEDISIPRDDSGFCGSDVRRLGRRERQSTNDRADKKRFKLDRFHDEIPNLSHSVALSSSSTSGGIQVPSSKDGSGLYARAN